MTARSITEARKFVAPEYVFGAGSLDLVGQYARNYALARPLLVTDPGVIGAGWADIVMTHLVDHGVRACVFKDLTSNPKADEVMKGADVFRKERCDGIIAVGGGSPIDCAKGIGIVVANEKPIDAFEGVDLVERPLPPLFCIPTTAGTGADVSQFAIITDTTRKVKMAVVSKAIVPDVALIDPRPLTTMSRVLTASTGLDALAHAIEAYASTAGSTMTDMHARVAIALVSKHLRAAVANAKDVDARGGMMLASLHAGLAFSNASLGAVHAMAHSLGGLLDLPHGECNALLLPHVIRVNAPEAPGCYREIAEAFGVPVEDASDVNVHNRLVDAVFTLAQDVGITHSLAALGVAEKDLSSLAENAFYDPCLITNPKELSVSELKELYGATIR